MFENVKKFEQALRENKELAEQFAGELKRITEERSAGNDAEAMAKAAQALGFDLTAADFEKASAETQEIDPEELQQTAGGFCWGDYDCYTIYHHDTPDDDKTACLFNHSCIIIAYEYNEEDESGL